MKPSRVVIASLLAALCIADVENSVAQPYTPVDMIVANDNLRPAGFSASGVLTVRLVARQGQWRPEGEDGPALDVAAFGEEGGPLLIPGPLLRVPEGAEIVVQVSNHLAVRPCHGAIRAVPGGW